MNIKKLEEIALNSPKVQKAIKGKKIDKIICVPQGKVILINIVTEKIK